METRFVTCDHCHGEGRIYVGHPNDPRPRDAGFCPACNGERVVEVKVESACDMCGAPHEDHDDRAHDDCGKAYMEIVAAGCYP